MRVRKIPVLQYCTVMTLHQPTSYIAISDTALHNTLRIPPLHLCLRPLQLPRIIPPHNHTCTHTHTLFPYALLLHTYTNAAEYHILCPPPLPHHPTYSYTTSPFAPSSIGSGLLTLKEL